MSWSMNLPYSDSIKLINLFITSPIYHFLAEEGENVKSIFERNRQYIFINRDHQAVHKSVKHIPPG